MFGPLNEALQKFQKKWQTLLDVRTDITFFQDLQPTGVGWKAEDLAEFDHLFKQLRAVSSQVHMGWVNERWLATFYLRDPQQLTWGIPLVKLMQRRPESSDPTGLDHVDFYSPAVEGAEKILESEPGLTWAPENNGEHCKWLSLRFSGTEAKLRTGTTLDACIAEMQDANRTIIGK